MRERIVSFDIAKGICIVLVALGHYRPENSPTWYLTMYDVMHTFRMPLFLFASGYIYIATRKDIGYGSFLLKKIKRLFVPYLATSAIIITLKLLTEGHAYMEHPITLLSYVRMFYLPEAGFFLWFVWALLWMFVAIPFFKTRESRLVLFVITFFLHILPIHTTELFCLSQLRVFFVYFMAGVVAFDYKGLQAFVIIFNRYKSLCLILLFGGVTSVLVATDSLGHNHAWGGAYALNILLPFMGILFIMEVSKLLERVRSERLRSGLLVTAAASYTIYLFHTTFMGFAKAICVHLPVDTDLWYVFVAEVIIVTGTGVLIPMILHNWLFKRYAATRFLFGL